jgi:hypothetical protein
MTLTQTQTLENGTMRHMILSLFPVAPTFEHRASVKRFVSFRFHNPKTALGILGRLISPSQRRYLHRTTQTQKKRGQTSMPWVGFEPTIPVLELAKTVFTWLHRLWRSKPFVKTVNHLGIKQASMKPLSYSEESPLVQLSTVTLIYPKISNSSLTMLVNCCYDSDVTSTPLLSVNSVGHSYVTHPSQM